MNKEFQNAGKTGGLQIWRVENFTPVLRPVEEHGKYYTEDSYIILNTIGKEKCFSYSIHYWLGSKTSQQKYAAAPIFAVQLRELLGAALLHREIQNEESSKFKSYFPSIIYLQGGTKDCLNKRKTADKFLIEKKLYKLKGNTILKKEKIELDRSKIENNGNYILDAYNNIYIVINNEDCRRILVPQATTLAKEMMNKNKCPSPKLITLDTNSNDAEMSQFFNEFRYRYIILEEKDKKTASPNVEIPPSEKKTNSARHIFLMFFLLYITIIVAVIMKWDWISKTESYVYLEHRTKHLYSIYIEPTIT